MTSTSGKTAQSQKEQLAPTPWTDAVAEYHWYDLSDGTAGGVESSDYFVTAAFARELEREHAAMFAWLERHYEAEEGPGETDRPEYVELRALLAKIRDEQMPPPDVSVDAPTSIESK